MKHLTALLVLLVFNSCATIHQDDLDSWVGVPVIALDTHSVFNTMKLTKTVNGDLETRNYENSSISTYCSPFLGTVQCNSVNNSCNNIFYIKRGVVQEYAPVGNCKTDTYLQPEERYKKYLSEEKNVK